MIKVHEHTRPDKEDERAHHVDVLDAHDEPVFLFHRGSRALDAAVGRGHRREHDLAVTTPDGVWHTLWRVPGTAPPAARLRDAFAELEALYVADGHHRTAAAVRLHAARAALPAGRGGRDRGLPRRRLPRGRAHRAALPPPGHSTSAASHAAGAARARCEAEFDVEAADAPVQPSQPHRFGLRTGLGWHRLRLRDRRRRRQAASRGWPSACCRTSCWRPCSASRTRGATPGSPSSGGPDGLAELDARRRRRRRRGSRLHPGADRRSTTSSRSATRGEVMPPKSTWFWPKPASGLLVHPLH